MADSRSPGQVWLHSDAGQKGGNMQILGFTHTIKCWGPQRPDSILVGGWRRDNNQLPPRSSWQTRKQGLSPGKPEPSLQGCPPFSAHTTCHLWTHLLGSCLFSPLLGRPEKLRLQVLSFPIGEQASSSADGIKLQLCMPHVYSCALKARVHGTYTLSQHATTP